MTIELITGNPGAGKTTYAVAKRLVVELVRTFEMPLDECARLGIEPGTKIGRRLVQAGIKGLLVDHEKLPHVLTGDKQTDGEVAFWNKLDAEGLAVWTRLPSDKAWQAEDFERERDNHPEVPAEYFRPSLFNWFLWVKPGDLVAVDEVQYIVPRGSMGKKPPIWIALLEIHRHYGVDFLFITQHPQLLDTTIRALVGVHRHVRSIMGSSLCMVYEWDHASNPERYTLANKSKFLRGKKHYRLFKSSTLHVKPPAGGRAVLFAVPVFACAVAYGLVHFKARLFPEANASTVQAAKPAPGALAAAAQGVGATAPVSTRPAGFLDVPELSGCWSVGDRCSCMDRQSRPVRVALAMCQASSSSFDGLVQWQERAAPLSSNYGAGATAAGNQAAATAAAAQPSASSARAGLFAAR